MPTDILASLVPSARIAYAVLDRDLYVQALYDPHLLFDLNQVPNDPRGFRGRFGLNQASANSRFLVDASSEIAGQRISLLDLAPELEGSVDVLRSVLAGDLPEYDLQQVNRQSSTGSILYVNILNRPHRDAEDRIVGLIHLVEDVTAVGELQQRLMQQRNELRLAQDELARRNLELMAANAELQRLDEAKSMFVSIAAHELRTPLAAISGYVDILLEGLAGELSDPQQRYLHIVREGAERLLQITNDLLDLTRLEAGKMDLTLRPLPMIAAVHAVVEAMQPQWQAKHLAVETQAAAGLPWALVDELRVHQVIGNLLSNAVKYTPEHGRIDLVLSVDTDPGYLRLAVRDTGIGISLADQHRLFSRFFRGEAAMSTNTSGTGLGLHIARSLVELHGGRIWLESTVGQGTTVYATFPAAGGSAEDGL